MIIDQWILGGPESLVFCYSAIEPEFIDPAESSKAVLTTTVDFDEETDRPITVMEWDYLDAGQTGWVADIDLADPEHPRLVVLKGTGTADWLKQCFANAVEDYVIQESELAAP